MAEGPEREERAKVRERDRRQVRGNTNEVELSKSVHMVRIPVMKKTEWARLSSTTSHPSVIHPDP
jgi:predicted transcriptional regulator